MAMADVRRRSQGERHRDRSVVSGMAARICPPQRRKSEPRLRAARSDGGI
jgi:hypothetical protein